MSLLVVNIGRIVGIDSSSRKWRRGTEMSTVGTLDEAWLFCENGKITSFGEMASLPDFLNGKEQAPRIDARGGWLFPSFCDSHTHIVYVGSREQEFEDRIRGLSYEEIARRGGGILNSARRLRATSEEDLYSQAMTRIEEITRKGTGAVEIKSGYGLSLPSEIKMLRVIARIKESAPITVKATFLGAHAFPEEYKGREDDYVDLICTEMIPATAAEGLTEFVDVFCDRGFFTPDQTARILDVAAKYGLKPKIHADELASSGGTLVAVEKKALSADHLERLSPEDMAVLVGSSTVATALPGASFFLSMPYAPARKIVDSDGVLAIASDYNPGSSPSGDMRFMMALGCIKLRLTPEEALNATTINGAAAMDLSSTHGSIAVGKTANFFLTEKLPSLAFMSYAYSTPLINTVVLNGEIINN